jgi:hypothetical protein
VIQILNTLLSGLFDLLFLPFRALPPIVSLMVFSVLAGVLMLWAFGKVSNQDSIRVVRDRIRGNLMGIRLFGDSISLLFRLQYRIFRDLTIYLKFALVPLLIMMIPLLLILTQLNLRYAKRSLEPGEIAMVKIQLRSPLAVRDGVTLEVPDGLTVETPGVRIEAQKEVAFRIRADREGRYAIVARAGEIIVEKEILVGGAWQAVSEKKTGANFFDQILYPGERVIPSSSPFRSVEVGYASRELNLLGFNLDWILTFLVVSIVAGFVFKGPLGVEF